MLRSIFNILLPKRRVSIVGREDFIKVIIGGEAVLLPFVWKNSSNSDMVIFVERGKVSWKGNKKLLRSDECVEIEKILENDLSKLQGISVEIRNSPISEYLDEIRSTYNSDTA